MNDFETVEADFAAPFLEIGGGIIERVAEFDQRQVKRSLEREPLKLILSLRNRLSAIGSYRSRW